MAKISIKQASKYRTPFDLSAPHFSTSDFGQIQVTKFLPVVPNDDIVINVTSQAYCAPMVVPTFMDVDLVHRAFYVPMSAIYPAFESFYTRREDGGALQVPTITNEKIVTIFTTHSFGLAYPVDSSITPDFVLLNQNYIFTEKGRLFLKTLHGLGYSINFATADNTSFSLLPLLAYMRVLYDYVYPNQYLDQMQLTKYFKVFTQSEFNTLFVLNNLNTFIQNFLKLLVCPYKQDYFTASWKQFDQPGTNKSVSNGQYVNVQGQSIADNSVNDADPNHGPQLLSSSPITQPILNLLSRMYDYVTRNNIVGTRFADRIFSRFGIGSRHADPDMSQFIGQHIQPLRVADVTAMTQAGQQDLGELAGKMFTNGNGELCKFNSIDEFGYIINLTFIQPKIGYYQGRRRWTTCNSHFDFFNPEFDMQMRGIRNDELYADFDTDTEYSDGLNFGGNPSNVFGFAPNYSEYKKGDAIISGDFRCPSLSRNLDAYHLLRDIPVPSQAHPLALNADFLLCQQHEYDKIFQQIYVTRVPFNTIRSVSYGDILAYDGKPVIFVYAYNNVNYFFLVTDITETSLKVRCYDDSDSVYLKWNFGIDYSDASTYFAFLGDDSKYPQQVVWDMFGTEMFVQSIGNHYVTPNEVPDKTLIYRLVAPNYPTLPVMSRILTLDMFLLPFRDYIDHIYLFMNFGIKATRNMAPISEEFMIQDGGNRLSVDMNGNRIV